MGLEQQMQRTAAERRSGGGDTWYRGIGVGLALASIGTGGFTLLWRYIAAASFRPTVATGNVPDTLGLATTGGRFLE